MTDERERELLEAIASLVPYACLNRHRRKPGEPFDNVTVGDIHWPMRVLVEAGWMEWDGDDEQSAVFIGEHGWRNK